MATLDRDRQHPKDDSGKLGRYLRIAALSTVCAVAGLNAPSTTSQDCYTKSAIAPPAIVTHPSLFKTVDIYERDAKEIIKKSYAETGKYDTKALLELQAGYFEYLIHSQTSSEEIVARWKPLIMKVASSEGVDPSAISVLVSSESAGYIGTVGKKGELGLMQIEQEEFTKEQYKKAFDPEENMRIGARLYKRYLLEFHGNFKKAFEAYNCGPERVLDGDVPEAGMEYSDWAMRHMELFEEEYNH